MEEYGSGLYLFSGHAVFTGNIPDTFRHMHHVMEIFIGLDEPVKVKCDDGEYTGKIVVISPDIYHEVGGLEFKKIILMLDADSAVTEKISKKYLCRRKASTVDVNLDWVVCKDSLKHRTTEKINSMYDIVLADILEEKKSLDKDPFPFLMNEHVRKALDFMQSLQTKKISCKKVAYEIGLSESRLIHLFKEHVGIPIRAYLLWLRLIDALRNIISGQSLTYAAHSAEFADYAHLSRTFSAMFGLSLSEIFKNKQSIDIII